MISLLTAFPVLNPVQKAGSHPSLPRPARHRLWSTHPLNISWILFPACFQTLCLLPTQDGSNSRCLVSLSPGPSRLLGDRNDPVPSPFKSSWQALSIFENELHLAYSTTGSLRLTSACFDCNSPPSARKSSHITEWNKSLLAQLEWVGKKQKHQFSHSKH